MTRRPDHGPACIACHDPAAARQQITADRTSLAADATRAREHRAAGDAADHQAVSYLIAGDAARHQQLQARALSHYQAANAIAQGVGMRRAHLDRVVAAHPALEVS